MPLRSSVPVWIPLLICEMGLHRTLLSKSTQGFCCANAKTNLRDIRQFGTKLQAQVHWSSRKMHLHITPFFVKSHVEFSQYQPCTSAREEQDFSSVGHTITDVRSRLPTGSVESIELGIHETLRASLDI